jgi:hypothetical protein
MAGNRMGRKLDGVRAALTEGFSTTCRSLVACGGKLHAAKKTLTNIVENANFIDDRDYQKTAIFQELIVVLMSIFSGLTYNWLSGDAARIPLIRLRRVI